MMRTTALLGFIGLVIATGLFVWQGFGPILKTFESAGFGVFWVALAHFLSMGLNARAWQILLPRPRPSAGFFLWAVWLRESVNGLLPVARIGGEIVTARLLMRRRLSPALAIASLILDVTLCLGAQFVFTLIGVALLIAQNNESPVVRDIFAGTVITLPVIVLFIAVQKFGLFTLMANVNRRLFGDRFAALAISAGVIDRKVARLYRRRLALLVCSLWQLAGFSSGALEIWLSLHFLNQPFSLLKALILESLIQAVSSSAFVVPGALGIQEGGFVIIGGLLGLAPEMALALALMRRARDIIVFAPALIVWQLSWGKKLVSRKIVV